jgi:ADP-ribose pyrophosphatase
MKALSRREATRVPIKPYKPISGKVVHKNPWWQYRLDLIELPSGKRGEYHYVVTSGSSMVIPESDDGRLLLVRQYRYTGKRDSIEFPCGGLKDGSTYDETAHEELVEETGFESGRLEEVGAFNPCNGLVDEICRVYIARDLRHVESIELVHLTAQEVDALIQDGTIWDGMTIAAWAIGRSRLKGRSQDR